MSSWGDLVHADLAGDEVPPPPPWRGIQRVLVVLAGALVVTLLLLLAVLGYILARGDVRSAQAAEQAQENQQLRSSICLVLDGLADTSATPAEEARLRAAAAQLNCATTSAP